MFGSACFRKFVVDTLQPLAQPQHRVPFAGEQRIHAHAALFGNLLEAAPFQLVRDKYFALLHRQLVKRQLEFIEQHMAGVERLRSGIGRRQQIFQARQFSFFSRGRGVAKALRLLLAKQIRDAIARHAKQPAGDMVNRHQQAVRFHQLVEHVLQNVLGVARVGHAPPDEVAQPGLLPLHRLGDPLVPFECHLLQTHRASHPLLKTNEASEYCRNPSP
jgi:hypothetical protein